MIILHLSPINMKTTNGFRFSVPGLVSAQSEIQGIKVALANVGNRSNLVHSEIQNFKFDFFEYIEDIGEMKPPYNKPDIVIFHGIYHLKYLKIYKQLLKNKIPYVLVPRVSLTEGAQKQKRIKKIIGNILLFNKFINNCNKIHFLTKNEMESSKNYNKEYFIIGNGINIPNIQKTRINKYLRITYMGRYDINHKGLDLLIESIAKIKEELKMNNIVLNFYGSDFRKGKKYLEKKIKFYGIQNIVKINDAVFGDKKIEILLNTDIFIATSRFEGHPMAVIEAMSYGIPCILTKGTNMVDKLVEYDAGWEADLSIYSIADTIIEAINSKDKLLIKGSNARKLVVENYDWKIIALKTIEQYRKIIKSNGG